MSTCLEAALTAEQRASVAAADAAMRAGLSVPGPHEVPHCVLLPRESIDGMDDMAFFLETVKAEVRSQFVALGFGNTAAGELAEIHLVI